MRRFVCVVAGGPFAEAAWRGRSAAAAIGSPLRQRHRWLTLKDIAAAFGEMASGDIESRGSEPRPSNTATSASSSSGAIGEAVAQPKDGDGHQRRRRHQQPREGPLQGRQYPPQQRRQEAEEKRLLPSSPPGPSSPVVTLSYGYAQHLASLSTPQLLAEMENAYRRVHYGLMTQSLMELSWRLSRVMGSDGSFPVVSAEEAAGAVRPPPRSSSGTGDFCRSDRLLEAALRCLTKMNLAQLEPDIAAAARAVTAATRLPHTQPVPAREVGTETAAAQTALEHFALRGASLSYCLGLQLLPWLAARVAVFDAPTSITFLHLLVQQRLFFSDDVLATLVDNVLVSGHHGDHGSPARAAPLPRADAAEGRGEEEDEPLTLRDFALLFDAIARCETFIHFAGVRWHAAQQQLAAQKHAQRRHREELSTSGIYFVETDEGWGLPESTRQAPLYASSATTVPATAADAPGGAGAAFPPHVRTTENTFHPVCNSEVYDVMARRLIRYVRRRQEALRRAVVAEEKEEAALAASKLFPAEANDESSPSSSPPTPPSLPLRRYATIMSRGGVWAELDTVSFFFLTRALGKLEYFHKDLVRTLLPGMAQYLQKHPEQFLGVIPLVGRRENDAADPALTQVLLQTLGGRLRRRAVTPAQTASPHVASDKDGTDLGSLWEDDGERDEGGDGAALTLPPEGTENGLYAEDAGGEANDESPLLSEEQRAGPAVRDSPNPSTPSPPTPMPTAATVKYQFSVAPQQRHGFRVSLIDIFTFHTFSKSLCHQYSLTIRLLLADAGKGVTDTAGHHPLSSPPLTVTAAAAAMERKMRTLQRLLLDDVHHGVPSLTFLFRLSPAVLEQTLEQVLAANELLLSPSSATAAVAPVEDQHTSLPPPNGEEGNSKEREGLGQDEDTTARYLRHHPFLVELAYVWTQQVAHSRLAVTKKGSHARIIPSLLESGVLERIVVVQRQTGEMGSGRGTYDSQGSSRRTGGGQRQSSPGGARDRALHVPCYVIPLPVLQASAPRVLGHVQQALDEQQARRGRRPLRGNTSNKAGDDGTSTATAASVADVLSNRSREATLAKKQKLLLARHFARFSTAVGL